MIDAVRKFAKQRPGLTLLICGVLLLPLPVGLGMNTKALIEHDLIPNHLWHLLPLVGVFQAIVGLTGFILIAMSALVSVRRWEKSRAEKLNRQSHLDV